MYRANRVPSLSWRRKDVLASSRPTSVSGSGSNCITTIVANAQIVEEFFDLA
jgi:hypothetical protein